LTLSLVTPRLVDVDRPQRIIATRSRTATAASALAILFLVVGCYDSGIPAEDGGAEFADGADDGAGAEDRGDDRDDVGADLFDDVDTLPDEAAPDVAPDSEVAADDADVTDTGTHCVGTPRPCSSHLDLWACEDSDCTWDPHTMTCAGSPPPCWSALLDYVCRDRGCEWV
jgi:hypothetical protein